MARPMTHLALRLQETINRRRASRRRDSRLRLASRLFAILIVLVGVLDVVSTNASIASGATETNALIVRLMTEMGPWWFVPKILVHCLVAAFVMWLPSRKLLRKARACVAIYTLIIASNFYIASLNVL